MKVHLFNNGLDGFEYLINVIDKATISLEIQMFIWRDDPIGNKMAQAVLAAAERGVRVKLSKDLIGGVFEYAEESKRSFFHTTLPIHFRARAYLLDKFYPMLGKKKGYLQNSNPLVEKMKNHPNIECFTSAGQYNHSKYYIVDDEILIITGMNIEFKEWQHDLLGRVYVDFLMALEDEQAVSIFRQALSNPKAQSESFDFNCLLSGNTPLLFMMNRLIGDRTEYFMRDGLVQFIQKATCSLDVIMAYVGDPVIMRALENRVNEGIKVRLFVPNEANLQNDLNRSYLLKLWKRCNGNLSIYLNRKMVHGKMMCVDHDLVTFGSCNLNTPAMIRLKETNICFLLSELHQKPFYDDLIYSLKEDSLRVEKEEDLHYQPFKAFLEKLV